MFAGYIVAAIACLAGPLDTGAEVASCFASHGMENAPIQSFFDAAHGCTTDDECVSASQRAAVLWIAEVMK
jgi:hypothetical protein